MKDDARPTGPIRFAVGHSSIGKILVAGSERGINAILLGDHEEDLINDLRRRFPKAQLACDDAGLEHWLKRVISFVEAPVNGVGLPLDVQGSAFEERVWNALLRVPAGSTASYGDIARRIGMPKAARAVARACAANPVAVAIPCHRVVRNDGSLGGYRWGIGRKRALLDREVLLSAKAAKSKFFDARLTER